MTATADNSTVLVTGGCGFIGTWVLRELLARGCRAVVLDAAPRPARWDRILGSRAREVSLIQGSLLERETLTRLWEEQSLTHVIHLAALLTPDCQADPLKGCQVNVAGTIALLEQMRAAGPSLRGFSYASSVAVFGDEPDHGIGGTGSDGHSPLTFYGVFKRTMEMLADQYWRHFRLPSVGLRPQVVYGPEREVGLTAGPSLAARAAALGQPAHIGYVGRVGYDYVEDVARAFVRAALETPPGARVLDLAGELAGVEEVLAAIEAVAPEAHGRLTAGGPALPAHAPPCPRYINELFSDWQTTTLIEGMRQTIQYYRPSAGA